MPLKSKASDKQPNKRNPKEEGMKKQAVFVAFLVILLGVCGALGFGQETYTPKPNEEIYGTWVNDEMMPPKVVINPDGSIEYYFPASYSKPYQGWKSEIVKKWTDSEGNVYYETYDTLTFGGTMEHTRFQCLKKVSKSGTVLEWNWVTVSKFGPEKFPPALDPTKNAVDVSGYLIYSRAKE
jgi:hypothetical protein